jgi:hypothetical protein
LGKWRDRLLGLHKPGIIFIHIPKTGGSSISASLRKHYRLSKFNIKSEITSLATQRKFGISEMDPDFDETLQQFRHSLIFHEAEKGTRFITGHFWVDEHLPALKPLGYKIVTCLRDPVDRWFSHYLYSRYKDGSYGRIEKDIDEFLSTRSAESFGTIYVRYLGGTRDDKDYTSSSAVQQAIANLDMFDIVGFLHKIDDFRKKIEVETGFTLRAKHRRQSPADPALTKRIKGSSEIRREVERLCEPDRKIYEQAFFQFDIQQRDSDMKRTACQVP